MKATGTRTHVYTLYTHNKCFTNICPPVTKTTIRDSVTGCYIHDIVIVMLYILYYIWYIIFWDSGNAWQFKITKKRYSTGMVQVDGSCQKVDIRTDNFSWIADKNIGQPGEIWAWNKKYEDFRVNFDVILWQRDSKWRT